MPFIPIADTVMLTAQYQDADGVVAINRHYCATTSVPTETDLEDIADTYVGYWIENFTGITESNWNLTGVITRAMNEEFGLEFVRTEDLPANGGIGTGRLPNQVSYTCTWLTGLVGRINRGRTYGVGIPGSFVATGQKRLTDEGQTALQSVWDGLRAAFETAGHAMQVVSLSEGGIPRTAGVTNPILAARVNFPLATQRRRLR